MRRRRQSFRHTSTHTSTHIRTRDCKHTLFAPKWLWLTTIFLESLSASTRAVGRGLPNGVCVSSQVGRKTDETRCQVLVYSYLVRGLRHTEGIENLTHALIKLGRATKEARRLLQQSEPDRTWKVWGGNRNTSHSNIFSRLKKAAGLKNENGLLLLLPLRDSLRFQQPYLHRR